MDVIVYQGAHCVAVMTPFHDNGMTVLETGKRDVPDNVPFWIMDSTMLPHEPQESWVLDVASLGKPSGIGGSHANVNGDRSNV